MTAIIGPLKPTANEYGIEYALFLPVINVETVILSFCMITHDNTFWWEIADTLITTDTRAVIAFESQVLLDPNLFQFRAPATVIGGFMGSELIYVLLPVMNTTLQVYSFIFKMSNLFWQPILIDWGSLSAEMVLALVASHVQDAYRYQIEVFSCDMTVWIAFQATSSSGDCAVGFIQLIEIGPGEWRALEVIPLKLVPYSTFAGNLFCYSPNELLPAQIYGVNNDLQFVQLNTSIGWLPVSPVCNTYIFDSFCDALRGSLQETAYGGPVSKQYQSMPTFCVGSYCIDFAVIVKNSTELFTVYEIYYLGSDIVFTSGTILTFFFQPGNVSTRLIYVDGAFGLVDLTLLKNPNTTISSLFYPRLSYTDIIYTDPFMTTQSSLGTVIDGFLYVLTCFHPISASLCDLPIVLRQNLRTGQYSLETLIGFLPNLGNPFIPGTLELSSVFISSETGLYGDVQTCVLVITGLLKIYAYCPQIRQFVELGTFPNDVFGSILVVQDAVTPDIIATLVLNTVSLVYTGVVTLFANQSMIEWTAQDQLNTLLAAASVPEPISSTGAIVWNAETIYVLFSESTAMFTLTTIIRCKLLLANQQAENCTSQALCPLTTRIRGITALLGSIVVYNLVRNSPSTPSFLILLDLATGTEQIIPIEINISDEGYGPVILGGVMFGHRSTSAIPYPPLWAAVDIGSPTLSGLQMTISYLVCPMGMFSPPNSGAPLQILCSVCGRGMYADSLNSSACTMCPSGSTTENEYSTTISNCTQCADEGFCHGHGNCFLVNFQPNCQCNFGYISTDQCSTPWMLIGTFSIITAILLIAFISLRVIKIQNALKAERSTLEMENRDYRQSWNIDWTDLEQVASVAVGGFGTVYSATWCGRIVAVKVMHDTDTTEIIEFEREARSLRSYRHPHIVLFFGVGINPERQRFIVTEFVDLGSLREILDKNQSETTLSWAARLNITIDIATAIEFLHHQSPPLIHRDVKSPNVLVTSSLRCKLGDLGTARMIHPASGRLQSQPRNPSRWNLIFGYRSKNATGTALEPMTQGLLDENLSTRVGTTKWSAPEVLRGDANYGLPVDIYAYGVLCWEVMTNEVPFPDVHWSHLVVERVLRGERPEWPQHHFAVDFVFGVDNSELPRRNVTGVTLLCLFVFYIVLHSS